MSGFEEPRASLIIGSITRIDTAWSNSSSCCSNKIFPSRPTFSQTWSSNIRRTTLLSFIKFADLLILRLWNCERAGRVAWFGHATYARPRVRLVCQFPYPKHLPNLRASTDFSELHRIRGITDFEALKLVQGSVRNCY